MQQSPNSPTSPTTPTSPSKPQPQQLSPGGLRLGLGVGAAAAVAADGLTDLSANGNLPSPGLQAQLSAPSQLPRLTEDQLKSLESNFQSNRNPSDFDIALIAAEVGLSESDVKRWFEHRLARWRQKQGLPANSRTIMD